MTDQKQFKQFINATLSMTPEERADYLEKDKVRLKVHVSYEFLISANSPYFGGRLPILTSTLCKIDTLLYDD